MNRQPGTDSAYMTTAIILLVAIMLLALLLYSLFIPSGYTLGTEARSGMARATDTLVLNGDITGYADLPGPYGTVRVDNPRPSPGDLGGFLVPIRLASFRLSWEEGTGADLGSATVFFTGPAGTVPLAGSSGPVLERSSWAVVQKGSTIPGRNANGDLLLEPNEAFVLFVYPPAPLPPGTPFSVEIHIPGENTFRFSRVVPEPVSPVMNLG